ncbi:MAG: S8 family serine peptidase [Nitrospinota bacterium]
MIPGQYIVELKRGVGRDAFINARGLAAFRRYTIINGFAARMSQQAADRLAANPRVLSVTPDLVVHAFAPEVVPTGVSRIGANPGSATGAGVKVAVIDTGIDFEHPDLAGNYKGGKNFVANGPPKDDHGHGTHVAGTIAAMDNTFGVVGVAPEVELYAVKVLNAQGSGSWSNVIMGLDWAAKNGMQVANMSLGGWDFSLGGSALCNAVKSAVLDYNVTVVAAAGNSAFEALYFTPANCAYSLTVSALADEDGSPGGVGGWLDYNGDGVPDEDDDTFAQTFSNYSNYCWDFDGDGLCTKEVDSLVVNLMAPGVAIKSTMPTYTVTLNGPSYNKALNYDNLTGTSMAAPHVAGAAALYIQSNPGATPEQVRVALTTGGACWNGTGNPDKGTGDSSLLIICDNPPWPDDELFGWPEPLLLVASGTPSGTPNDAPVVLITSPADGSTFASGATIDFVGSASDTEDGDLTASLVWTSSIDGPIGTGGSFSRTLSDGNHTITASVTDSGGKSGSASVSVTVQNSAPSVSITSPVDGSSFDSGATILFEGMASDTEDGDLTASLVWTSDINGPIGTGGSFSTTLSDGDHIITASVTDSGGKTGSAPVSITVGTPPAVATIVSVVSIDYATEGGKNKDRNLLITLTNKDDLGQPVAGASDYIWLMNWTTGERWSATRTTGTDGTMTVNLKNASSGCYNTAVANVTADGLIWDKITPANKFCK